MNPRDWVQGCHKPIFVRCESIVKMMFRCFCTVISLTYGRGVVGYKRREIGRPPSHFTKMIYELPDRSFLGGLLFTQHTGITMKNHLFLMFICVLSACEGSYNSYMLDDTVNDDNIIDNNIQTHPFVLNSLNPYTPDTYYLQFDENDNLISIIDMFGEHQIDANGQATSVIENPGEDTRQVVQYNLKGHLVGTDGLRYSNFGTIFTTDESYIVEPEYSGWQANQRDAPRVDIFYGGDSRKQIEKPSTGEFTFDGLAIATVIGYVSGDRQSLTCTDQNARLILKEGKETLTASFANWYDIMITNDKPSGTLTAILGTNNHVANGYSYDWRTFRTPDLKNALLDTQYYGENDSITEAVAGASFSGRGAYGNLRTEIGFGGKKIE